MFDQFDQDDLESDYDTMLANGGVGRNLSIRQHERWRSAMRKLARRDGISIRTRSLRPGRDLPCVTARITNWEYTAEDIYATIIRLGFVTEDGEPDVEAYTEWFNTA